MNIKDVDAISFIDERACVTKNPGKFHMNRKK